MTANTQPYSEGMQRGGSVPRNWPVQFMWTEWESKRGISRRVRVLDCGQVRLHS